jgi:Fe-S-cluster-containing dehydrogenase component
MERRSFIKSLAVLGGAAVLPCAGNAAEGEALPGAVGMLYDSTLCIGCKTCVVKCREANGMTPQKTKADHGLHDMQTDLDYDTKTVIKLFRNQESEGPAFSFIKQQCMHCLDPACVSACMLGSLQKREHGVVTYDVNLCVGCRYCQIACPFGVPKFDFSSATPTIVKCEMCMPRLKEGKEPGCTEVCPRKAVIYGKREDLLKEAHARLARQPGRYQPKVYGEHDAGGTQVLYLNPKGIPFEKVGLPVLGDESVPHLSDTVQETVYQGMLTPAALFAGLAFIIRKNHKHEHDEKHDDKKEGADDHKS